MEKCLNCDFWEPHWTDDDGKAKCNRFGFKGKGSDPDDSAYMDVRVKDDHGLEIEFKTGPSFGCAQFKGRRQ